MTNEQYLALSKLAYVDFSDEDVREQKQINALKESIKDKFRKDKDYLSNPIIQNILPQLNDYKLIAHQPNTPAGFAGSAFESPDGKIVFAS